MNASFEEKSVWIQLIAVTLVFGGYFGTAVTMLTQGVDRLDAYLATFLSSLILLVIVLIAGHVVAAIVDRANEADERDRIIAWRAEASSAWIVVVGVIAAISCMMLSVAEVWTANLLLLSLFVASIVQYVLQLIYYRRGL
jgi:hypothetical protein